MEFCVGRDIGRRQITHDASGDPAPRRDDHGLAMHALQLAADGIGHIDAAGRLRRAVVPDRDDRCAEPNAGVLRPSKKMSSALAFGAATSMSVTTPRPRLSTSFLTAQGHQKNFAK